MVARVSSVWFLWTVCFVVVPAVNGSDSGAGQEPLFAWTKQNEEDHFEVLYLEYVIASWNLSGTPWNAYHSAIAVRNVNQADQGVALVADYAPRETDEIRHVVHPAVISPYPSFLNSLMNLLGIRADKSRHQLDWNNKAYVNLDVNIDRERYKNITFLGEATGKAVNQLSQWIYTYNQTHDTFEPLEIAVEGEGTVVPSTICHDFVTEALWVLYDSGEAQFDPENHIFRDHIVLYGSSVEKVAPPYSQNDWDSIVGYYENVEAHMGIINVEFTNARIFFARMFARQEPTYLFSGNGGGWYNKFHLTEPYLNYCYMPLYMPPERSNIFTSPKHCALPQTLDDNQSLSLTATHYLQLVTAQPGAYLTLFASVCLLVYSLATLCRRRGEQKVKAA